MHVATFLGSLRNSQTCATGCFTSKVLLILTCMQQTRALCPPCRTGVVFSRVDVTGGRKIQFDLLYPFRMRLKEFPDSLVPPEGFDLGENCPAHQHGVTRMATIGNTHDRRAQSVPTLHDGTNSGRICFRLVSQNQYRRFRFRANRLKAISNGSATSFAEVGCFHKPGSNQRNAPPHLFGLMAEDDQHFIQRRAFHLADDPLQKSRPAPRQKLLGPGSKTSRFSRSQNQARNTSTYGFASTETYFRASFIPRRRGLGDISKLLPA